MTTSAVSQQLQKLEQELGISLFNRSTRQLTLTEAGKIQYHCCRAILETAGKAQEEIAQLQQTPSGKLKLIAPVGFGGGLLSQPLMQLLHNFPKLRLDLSFTDDPPDLIAAGADLAIQIGPLSDSSMIARHLVDWRLVLCVASDHLLAKQPLTSPFDLPENQLIGHAQSSRFSDKMRHADTGETAPLPEPRMMLDNMQVVIQFVRDGLGYALLPEPEIQEELHRGRLTALLPKWECPRYSVYAVAPSRDSMPAKTRAVIDSLQQSFEKVSATMEQRSLEGATRKSEL